MRKFNPGINHIEFWVSNLERAINFYSPIFQLVGWRKLNDHAFSTDSLEIYFIEKPKVIFQDSTGVRHICLQAVSKEIVDNVGRYLAKINADIINGPKFMPYTQGYYTVDFRDPDKNIFEVAHTPFMEFS